MEKTLGKIIRNRRVKPPFKGMSPTQKVPFSSLVVKEQDDEGEGATKKIWLIDYTVTDSKIDKEAVTVQETDSSGQIREITRQVPSKVLAIRFKKIIKTFVRRGSNDEEVESYQFLKDIDEEGNPTENDAEFYAFTGSRIMIDQAENDFTQQDLPVATIIRQVKGKDGKSYTKFT